MSFYFAIHISSSFNITFFSCHNPVSMSITKWAKSHSYAQPFLLPTIHYWSTRICIFQIYLTGLIRFDSRKALWSMQDTVWLWSFLQHLGRVDFLVVGLHRRALQVPCNLWKRCCCWKEFRSDAIGIFTRTSPEALFELKSKSLLNSWNLFSGFMNQNTFWYINNLGKHVLIA